MKQQGQRAASAGRQPAAHALAKRWAFTLFFIRIRGPVLLKI